MRTVDVMKRERYGKLQRIGVLLCLSLMLCFLTAVKPQAAIKQKKIFATIRVGQTVKLKLDGCDQSLIWRIGDGDERVTLNQDKRTLLTAEKKGNANVFTVFDGVRYKIVFRIKKRTDSQSDALRTISIKAHKVEKTGTPPADLKDYKAPERANLATTCSIKGKEEDLILIGDSRFEGMQSVVGGKANWLYKTGEGLNWLNGKVTAQLRKMDLRRKVIVFNLGVNDLVRARAYVNYLNKLGSSLRGKGATLYFMTVNPVDEKLEKKHGYKVSNKDIIEFNRIVAQNLIGFGIIDTYDYLVDHAFFTADGLHYKAETYKMIYKVLSDAILL